MKKKSKSKGNKKWKAGARRKYKKYTGAGSVDDEQEESHNTLAFDDHYKIEEVCDSGDDSDKSPFGSV